ncbi:GNAT family N-acetyltransferase [Halobacillus sp. ACCC02827]|uniref:GNAT family N-acetyltransferase n=1 Tax=unclassified Halobacillus TaxID=2636472 RepID=UPI0002A51561|nr:MULTISPECIES: GNAT family N-acetyltransferase [unclassified Halobacillus]ELK48721.1 hypothetical protein D479_02037 [Halobacillus sp. BAB-2008]WJE16125.1 GNAT family N-acetyltransferase [Halobacillus sp. ACCC02827]
MDRTIHESKGEFYIGGVDSPDAQLFFEEDDNVITITSTEVTPAQREQGLGKDLVDHVVNYARKEKKKVDPVCSFAYDVIKSTPEYHVVWKE